MCLPHPQQLHQTQDGRGHGKLGDPATSAAGVERASAVDRPHPQGTPTGPPHLLQPHLQEADGLFSLQEDGQFNITVTPVI